MSYLVHTYYVYVPKYNRPAVYNYDLRLSFN